MAVLVMASDVLVLVLVIPDTAADNCKPLLLVGTDSDMVAGMAELVHMVVVVVVCTGSVEEMVERKVKVAFEACQQPKHRKPRS